MRLPHVLVLLSFVFTVSALVTPHIPHSNLHRRLSARVNAVENSSIRRRADGKRCKPRTTTTSSSPAAIATPHNDIKVTTTTPKEDSTPTTIQEQKQTPPTTPKAANTPKADPSPAPTSSPFSPPKAPSTPKPTPSTGVNVGVGVGVNVGGNAVANFLPGQQHGQGTFYDTGLGACGITNNNGDFIAAASRLLFDSYPGYNGVNPNTNPMCGRKVRATFQGKSVDLTLTDRCEACAMTDLDLSPTAFNQIANPALGRIDITWEWI